MTVKVISKTERLLHCETESGDRYVIDADTGRVVRRGERDYRGLVNLIALVILVS